MIFLPDFDAQESFHLDEVLPSVQLFEVARAKVTSALT